MSQRYWKVLIAGKSAHGGTLTWSLPTLDGDDWQPGQWTPPVSPVVVCERGYHLTSDPTQWLKAGCEVYLAEGRGESQAKSDKTAFAEARLLRPAPEMIPEWWKQYERFVAEMPRIPWCQPDGNPKPEWRLFTAPTLTAARTAARTAAWTAAWTAARNAAWTAAWDAAWDAELYAHVQHICDDIPIDQRHRDHVEARWEVWRKGWCLLCDVDGFLYVYAQEQPS